MNFRPSLYIPTEKTQPVVHKDSLANEAFAVDMADFLKRERSGHLATHVMAAATIADWEALTQLSVYYPFWGDVDIILRHEGFYRNLIRPKNKPHEHVTLIDLGPGSQHAIMKKTLELVRIFEADCYVAVDKETQPLIKSRMLVQHHFNQVAGQMRKADFFKDDMDLGVNSSGKYIHLPQHGKRVFVAMGIPFGNAEGFPSPEASKAHLIKCFNNVARHMRPGDILIASFDLNRHQPSLDAAYGHPLNLKMVNSTLQRVPTDLDKTIFDFDISAFEQWASWMPDQDMYGLGITARHDVRMMVRNEPAVWSGGDINTFMHSYKHEVPFIEQAIANSNLKCEIVLPDKDNRIHHYVMELAA